MEKKAPTFIDLFAGIGGFRLGFEQAGYKCVYSCEIDSACQEVYFNNFKEKPQDDITEINIDEIPDFDVLTAGFPCQPFSICGKRQGFEDTRGTLFFHICEIIEAKQPSVVLLENVKYLLHHDKGRTLDIILYSLEYLGYLVDYKVLNSKDFNLPQNRERIIIFATKYKKFNFNLIPQNNFTEKLSDYLCKKGSFEYLQEREYILIDNPKKQNSGLIFVGYRNNKTTWKKGVRPNTQHLSRVHHQPNRIYSVEGVHPTIPYITPTLKELNLPAMAESGWLTRSLEQPYPYTLNYNGKINNKAVKEAFLNIIEFVENNPDKTELITQLLIHQVKEVAKANQISIVKLTNSEKLNIVTVINCLEAHFNHNYQTFGAYKLPVIAFYAIYKRLIEEVERYRSCTLKKLGSHTSSDKTSKTAGDIEIFDKNKKLIEAIEIKQGKPINLQIVLNAKDKIVKHNPRRYYIFSSIDILKEDEEKIQNEIEFISKNHGCQVIINGIIPTLKYYLRLITSVENFIEDYSKLIEQDKELQAVHKIQWNNILQSLNLE